MIVTVMSDASFCYETNASGFGVWAKSDRGNFQAGGNFKSEPCSPGVAEAMAVSIALFAAVKQGIAQKGDHVILQTDCMMLLAAYKGSKLKKTKGRDEIFKTVKWTKQFIQDNALTIDLRHVRAHAPKEGKRNYINDVCDKLAKQAMRKQKKSRREAGLSLTCGKAGDRSENRKGLTAHLSTSLAEEALKNA